jgi:ribosomal protein S18 acetylase RimI-like enzyme
MTTDPLARPSIPDTDRFGKRIYRAEVRELYEVGRLLAECAAAGAELLMVRCSAQRLDLAQELERAGAVLTDTLVYFQASTAGRPAVAAPAGLEVRSFEADDWPALEGAARSAFEHFGGHYHADSRLDANQATEGYVDWFRRSITDRDFRVLVAARAGLPLGFLTLRRAALERPAEIVLNAVSPAAQRQGVYDALVKAALVDCRSHDEARVITSTQLANVAPQKVWIRNGFEPFQAQYTFHHWFV